jgi:hypothetical protein
MWWEAKQMASLLRYFSSLTSPLSERALMLAWVRLYGVLTLLTRDD